MNKLYKIGKGIMCCVAVMLLSSCDEALSPDAGGHLVPKTVDQDPALPAISVNGTLLHAEAFGNPNDPIIINLHGGPGADYRYMLQSKALVNNGFFVVFYDQRGSGLSQRYPKDSFSIQLMIDDLTAVINRYRKSPTQKVYLLGHSWGAMLATAYINQFPTGINGAILAEPGGFTWTDTEAYISRSRKFDLTSELFSDFLFVDQFVTAKTDQHEILDYKLDLLAYGDFAKDNLIGNNTMLPYWRSGAVVNAALLEIGEKAGFDWTTNLSRFTTKILFIYSERNKAYGMAHAQKVSKPYPNVQFVQMPNVGHDMIYEDWTNFQALTLTYLQALK